MTALSARILPCVFSVLLALMATAVAAGPIADFEHALRAAYADYRTALFESNRKNAAATAAALEAFAHKWQVLSARWGEQPPPHLSEDPQLRASLDRITRIAAEARAQTAAGDIARAHDTLEEIRRVLGALRDRNGQITFSDRMDAFHEAMEHAVDAASGALDAASVGALREQAGVLGYLASSLRRHRPAETGSDRTFEELLATLEQAVAGFLGAVRSGDAAAIKAAAQKLKPAYGRLFLKYG